MIIICSKTGGSQIYIEILSDCVGTVVFLNLSFQGRGLVICQSVTHSGKGFELPARKTWKSPIIPDFPSTEIRELKSSLSKPYLLLFLNSTGMSKYIDSVE